MRINLYLAVLGSLLLSFQSLGQGKTKTENFDKDPGWEGSNNRSALQRDPRIVRQDFGYSPTNNSGGARAGEVGGYIMQAGEAAYYARKIDQKSFNDELSASGTFAAKDGAFNLLVGFFNADTTNEWRTPNAISLRLQGRGEFVYAHVEYCTSLWRAGGDNPKHLGGNDPQTGKRTMFEFKSALTKHTWSIRYDPKANSGMGAIIATVDDKEGICNLDSTHKEDGATFNRFGIMNVMKSADNGTEVWFDDITINGEKESFDKDPGWEGKDNRKSWPSLIVRPWFNFGFSDTHLAGGKSKGELGGQTFRGDCRYPERMACYGDKLSNISLEKPIKASGKIVMTRGVTDSTTLFGFYNSVESMKQTDSQKNMIPESCLGICVEGPSAEGFLFYPVLHPTGAGMRYSRIREFPHIYPNGKTHDWAMDYDPAGAGGKGQITITFDGKKQTMDLEEGDKQRGTKFDRFGILTTWIDGNSQNVYWDDLTYTISQD